jgi:phthalate 4,5-cis-dihydrodiol dehydrogenase
LIRVGVLGAGAAALTAHLPALRACERFELAGLCDVSEARLAEALERFPVRGVAMPEELLAIPGLDAVIVATPPQTHCALATAALRAGLHVLCEKPLAPSVAECRNLIDLAMQSGSVLAVGHEKRFHPTLERVRSLLADGAIGEVFYGGVHWAAAAKLEPDRLIPEGFRHGYEWRWRDPAVGGGLVQDHLPHYVDLVRHWTGREPEAVQAHCLNVARDLLGWPAEKSRWEDFGLVVLRFSGGLLIRFETSVVGRSISPIWSLGSGLGEWTEYGYLLGTDGQLVFDLMPWDSTENGRLALSRRGGPGWVHVDQREPERRLGGAASAMFRAQLEAFADAIEGRESRLALGADGLVGVAAVEAAYRAADAPAEILLP